MDRAVEWISKAFVDSSELLKHELAYCLGQMQNPSAIPYLIDVLSDLKQGYFFKYSKNDKTIKNLDQLQKPS